MKSVNFALRKAYISLFSSIELNSLPVPVYYLQAPEEEQSNAYILLVSPSNTSISTKQSHDTNTSMQVQIHTWQENGNAGKEADDLAHLIYQALIPNPTSVIDLTADGFQVVSMKMESDNVQTISGHGNREFVTRIINFSHNIFHL